LHDIYNSADNFVADFVANFKFKYKTVLRPNMTYKNLAIRNIQKTYQYIFIYYV